MINKKSADFFRKLVIDNKMSRNPDQPMNDIFETLLKTQDPNGITLVHPDSFIQSIERNFFLDQNDEALTGRSVTLYFEGSETSSIALSYTLYELAKNPDVQERLYAEICETLAKNNGDLTFEALSGLKYLENVFSESLRVHSPGMFLAKQCTSDYTLPSIGNNPPVTIKPGTSVLIPVRALHL